MAAAAGRFALTEPLKNVKTVTLLFNNSSKDKKQFFTKKNVLYLLVINLTEESKQVYKT